MIRLRLGLLALVVLTPVPAAAAPSPPDTLRVLTFNMMYEPALAGGGLAARWPLIVDLLRDSDADLIALQEVLPGRIEPLRQALPGYEFAVSAPAGNGTWPSPFVLGLGAFLLAFAAAVGFALHRRSSRLLGAWLGVIVLGSGVFITQRLALVGTLGVPSELLVLASKRDHLQRGRSQTMWLSSTPLRPGTHGRFDTGPHIVLLADFIGPDGQSLRVLNVHVGHSPLERSRAAQVLRRILDPSFVQRQILLGDLNATPDNPLLSQLHAPRPLKSGFRDAWVESERRSGPATTYHWTRPARDFLPLRIDYVLLRGPVRAIDARVEGRQRGDAVASDHDALIVDLELPREGQ